MSTEVHVQKFSEPTKSWREACEARYTEAKKDPNAFHGRYSVVVMQQNKLCSFCRNVPWMISPAVDSLAEGIPLEPLKRFLSEHIHLLNEGKPFRVDRYEDSLLMRSSGFSDSLPTSCIDLIWQNQLFMRGEFGMGKEEEKRAILRGELDNRAQVESFHRWLYTGRR